MKTVQAELKGGLGNQLFIYFAAADYAEQCSANLIVDARKIGMAETERAYKLGEFFLPIPFEIRLFKIRIRNRYLSKFFREFKSITFRLRGYFYHQSEEIGFVDLSEIPIDSDVVILDSYYQSWRYFENLKIKDRNFQISLRNPSEWYLKNLKLMYKKNIIGLHFRRGDFLKFKNSIGVLSENYYLHAISKSIEHYHEVEIWAFGDDLEYIKENKDRFGINYIPELGHEIDEVETLLLMSKCQSLIISNSTFSWWAATFSSQETRITYPSPWHKNAPIPRDLIPEGWTSEIAEWV